MSAGLVVIRPPGLPGTYINELLRTDPIDFPNALGWSMVGVLSTSTQVAFAVSPLGQKISTFSQPDGKLFLANIYMPSGTALGTVQLIEAGLLVQQIDFAFPIPEPAGIALVSSAVLAGLARVRRGSLCRSH